MTSEKVFRVVDMDIEVTSDDDLTTIDDSNFKECVGPCNELPTPFGPGNWDTADTCTHK